MTLPAITGEQEWCCENGCGSCTPKQIDFEYFRSEDAAGKLIESRTAPVWRSDCCEAELILWDKTREDFVDWQPVAEPATERPS